MGGPVPDDMIPLDEERLGEVMIERIDGATAIAGLRRLSGGASQETWAFDVVTADGPVPLILRRAPGGGYVKPSCPGLDVEAAVIRAAAKAGVPVPSVRYVLTPEDGLGQGFVTAFVEGETIARRILRDDRFAAIRPQLAYEFGRILAKIHATSLDGLPPLATRAPREVLESLLADYGDAARSKPVFAYAERWLFDTLPDETAELTLVHGDFRNGNLIIGPDGVRAVLDWENVRIGDPMDDLGWVCVTPWRFGNVDEPVGGVGQRADLFAGYESESGVTVDPARVHWWEVLGSLRWGYLCSSYVDTFRSGIDRTVERAMIARRASENEIDLLRLLRWGNGDAGRADR